MAIPDDYLDASRPEPLDEVSRLMRDGDLLLCSATDPFSRLIGWATRSPWTHVALAYRWPQLGRIMVFEAVQQIGVRTVPLKSFVSQSSTGRKPYPGRIVLARNEACLEKSVRYGATLERLADFATAHLGNRFAPNEIFKIAVRILMGRLGMKMPALLEARDEFICSEFVAAALAAMGVEIPWDGLGFIAPSDFAQDPDTRPIAQVQTL